MASTTCIRCNGTGLFNGRTSYVDQNNRPFCFGCKGSGQATVQPARASKVQQMPTTIRLADRCGGDPTKIDPNNSQLLAYLGITADQLDEYVAMWNAGVREVAR